MKIRYLVALAAVALTPALVASSPASAAVPEYPHGVGVCISQVAIDPSLVGISQLGDAISAAAGPGQPGSDVPATIDGARGDGPTGCGAPPGPHQSGA